MAESDRISSKVERLHTGRARIIPAEPPEQAFKSSKERLRVRLYSTLVVLDLASIAIAFILGNVLRLGQPFHPQGRDMLVLLLPIYAGMAFDLRAYSMVALDRPRWGIARAIQALAIAFAVVMGFLFYMKTGPLYSRLALAISTLGAFTILPAARHFFGKWATGKYRSFVNEVLLIDGLSVRPDRGQITIFAETAHLSPTMDDPVMLDRVGRFLVHCDRVVLACTPDRRLPWSRMLKGMDVDVELLAPELDHMGALGMRYSHGRRTVLVSCGPLGLRDRILKRGFDLAVTLPAVLLFGPLMLMVAAAIKLESPGPVFFRQPRVGRGNRIFQVLKFRSMRTELSDPAGTRSVSRDDDRITRVGRFIRRTSIDELPQLFNVLKGEMSIVGPRPHALASTAGERLFWVIDDRYLERHIVKPGITGLAQVRGYRGATLTEDDLINRLQADLDYLAGWSIWRDCRILLNTFRVLSHTNAY